MGIKKPRLIPVSLYSSRMVVTLPLNEMTVFEKLQMMEVLWADLSRHDDTLESPDWHREILEDRESRISSGLSKFSDWEQAKADIRKRVS